MWCSRQKMQCRNPKIEPPGGLEGRSARHLVSSAAPPSFLNATRAKQSDEWYSAERDSHSHGPFPRAVDCNRERQPATATSLVLLPLPSQMGTRLASIRFVPTSILTWPRDKSPRLSRTQRSPPGVAAHCGPLRHRRAGYRQRKHTPRGDRGGGAI